MKSTPQDNPLQVSTQCRRTLRHMPRRAMWLVVCSCAVIGIGAVSPARGQGINREYKLKAVYLYKFATYVKWPEGAFRDSDSPFVIGILGPDPVGAGLRKIAKRKKINGRKIEVRTYEKADEIRGCHILFMSRSLENAKQKAAIKRLSKRSILFVGETSNFLKQGGVCDFVIRDNRVHIYISKSAYEREDLEMSARLLRIATVLK